MSVQDNLTQIGEHLRELRQAKGWTLRKAGEVIGFSASYLCDIEHGRRNPSLKQIGRIAAAYDMGLWILIGHGDVLALADRVLKTVEGWIITSDYRG